MRKLRDSEIEQWVLRELGLSNAIHSREICVLARDGVVTLRGTVAGFSNKMAASHAARVALGVVSVVNRMRVKPEPVMARSVTVPLAARPIPGLFAEV